jgi:hypothetical protein
MGVILIRADSNDGNGQRNGRYVGLEQDGMLVATHLEDAMEIAIDSQQ